MADKIRRSILILIMIWVCFFLSVIPASAAADNASWEEFVLVHNLPVFEDAGEDARGLHPGKWGSEYGRMAKMSNGNWIAVCSVYDNNGYTKDSDGGVRLKVSVSENDCVSWKDIATISEGGRDLDNGQIVQLNNGDLLLCCRSVKWQESYRINIYKSMDGG